MVSLSKKRIYIHVCICLSEFQEGATASWNGEIEDGDGGSPLKEQTSPTPCDNGPLINNNSVSTPTHQSI